MEKYRVLENDWGVPEGIKVKIIRRYEKLKYVYKLKDLNRRESVHGDYDYSLPLEFLEEIKWKSTKY